MQQSCCRCHLVGCCHGAVLCPAAQHPAALRGACTNLDPLQHMRIQLSLSHASLSCLVPSLKCWQSGHVQDAANGSSRARVLSLIDHILFTPAAIAAFDNDDGVGGVAAGHADLRDGQHICVWLLRVFQTKAAWAAKHGSRNLHGVRVKPTELACSSARQSAASHWMVSVFTTSDTPSVLRPATCIASRFPRNFSQEHE